MAMRSDNSGSTMCTSPAPHANSIEKETSLRTTKSLFLSLIHQKVGSQAAQQAAQAVVYHVVPFE